jgi:hypothetical protein
LKTLISVTWALSGAFQNFALLGMLAGIFLVAWAIVRHLSDVGDGATGALPRAAWGSKGAKIGFALLFSGLALETLSVAVRLLLPGRS